MIDKVHFQNVNVYNNHYIYMVRILYGAIYLVVVLQIYFFKSYLLTYIIERVIKNSFRIVPCTIV